MSDTALIYDFLMQNTLMSLATATTKGDPEVATVGYVLDDGDLLINTFEHYRKYPNLINNPQAACVITQNGNKTLQIQVVVKLLQSNDAADAKQKMLVVEPGMASFFDDPRTRFFRLTPTWMRLRDYTRNPMQVTEVKL